MSGINLMTEDQDEDKKADAQMTRQTGKWEDGDADDQRDTQTT